MSKKYFISIINLLVCHFLYSQISYDSVYNNNLKKIILKEIIPQMGRDTTVINLNSLTKENITIICSYDISYKGIKFNPKENLCDYLELDENNFEAVLFNESFKINIVVKKEKDSWKYHINPLTFYTTCLAFNDSLFTVAGMDGYWFVKNNTLYTLSKNCKTNVPFSSFVVNSSIIEKIHFAAYSTGYKNNKMSKDEFERVSDSLWIQSIKNKN